MWQEKFGADPAVKGYHNKKAKSKMAKADMIEAIIDLTQLDAKNEFFAMSIHELHEKFQGMTVQEALTKHLDDSPLDGVSTEE